MTSPPDALFLRHMLDAIIHELQILGAAAGRISRELTDRHPEVPWRKVSGLRHKIVHDYFALDLKVVWDTPTLDPPALRSIVQALLDRTSE